MKAKKAWATIRLGMKESTSREAAAEDSSGRKPGDPVCKMTQARGAGDRYFTPVRGRVVIVNHIIETRCRPFGASVFKTDRLPRAYARGYTLPPLRGLLSCPVPINRMLSNSDFQ